MCVHVGVWVQAWGAIGFGAFRIKHCRTTIYGDVEAAGTSLFDLPPNLQAASICRITFRQPAP